MLVYLLTKDWKDVAESQPLRWLVPPTEAQVEPAEQPTRPRFRVCCIDWS
jgi:hypothetical protein